MEWVCRLLANEKSYLPFPDHMIGVTEGVITLLHEEPHATFFRRQQPHKTACILPGDLAGGTLGIVHRAPLNPTLLLKKKLVWNWPLAVLYCNSPSDLCPVLRNKDITTTFLPVIWPDLEEITEQFRHNLAQESDWSDSLHLTAGIIYLYFAGKLERKNYFGIKF